jgi:hypothetical protein
MEYESDSSDGSFVDHGWLRDDDFELHSTVDELGYPDMTVLQSYVDVLQIKNIADSIEYVNAALAEATRGEYERLKIAVLGDLQVLPGTRARARGRFDIGPPDNKTFQTLKKHGGALAADSCAEDIDQTDPWLAKLFELVDAIHDLDREDDHAMRIFLEESIGARLPSTPALTLGDLKDKTKFIDKMTDAAEIVFSFKDGTVHRVSPNPMKGRNLEGGDMRRPYKGPGFVFEVKSNDMASADICFKRSPVQVTKRVAVIDDLVKLRDVMDKSFGKSKTRYSLAASTCLDVIIDQDMHPDTRRAHCHLVAWMIGFKTLLSTIKHKFEKAGGRDLTMADEDAIKATTNLRFVYCDATLMDGGRIKGMDHSAKKTGKVYHKDSEIRFEFVGPNAENQYGYKAWSKFPQYNPLDENDRSRGDVHREVTNGLYEDKVTGRTGEEESTDKEKVFNAVKAWKARDYVHRVVKGKRYKDEETGQRGDEASTDKKDVFDTVKEWKEDGIGHVAYLAARARAGDWGQIEHCKKICAVFITADRLSAMYATYRGVGVILVRHDDRIQTKDKTTYAHYRFCFGLPRQAVQEVQTGGGIGWRWGQAALVGVTVLAAIVGSVFR